MFRLLLATWAIPWLLVMASPAHAASCEGLAALQLPHTTIRSVQTVAAGQFTNPDKTRQADLPAFCRVVADVKTAPDSDINVEVWLPVEHWTRVFHADGNGGFAGSLSVGYPGMEAALRRGYATATTDMGTAPATVLNGDALIGHPRKWKDWGLLSTHVMTLTGKAITKAYYGEDARRAYFTGCSTGGQQGLIEAQYYPGDYDGILIGAPVIDRTWGHALALWDWQAANLEPGHKLSTEKLALLHKAVLADCAGKANGLASDPFLADPSACRFDPASILCKAAETGACLTPGEVETARAYYSGPVDRSGRRTYFGWPYGSEGPGGGWDFLESPPNNEPAFDGLFKWVFGASWDWRAFDFARDMPRVDTVLGPDLNGAMKGDMDAFRARGGKLIIYQGWADTLVAPDQTLAFYARLARRYGGTAKLQSFARLFMAPGMKHCGGGDGPDVFNSAGFGGGKPPTQTPRDDLFVALSRWVEDGAAPSEVVATKYVDAVPSKGVVMQRPLCAWPKKAWYRGQGDTNSAASFVCAVGKRGT